MRLGNPKLGSRLGESRLLGLCAHRRLGRPTGKTRSFQAKLGAKLRLGNSKLSGRLSELRRLRCGLLLLRQTCQAKL